MNNYKIVLYFCFFIKTSFAQFSNSKEVYYDDQFYARITFNKLINQPKQIKHNKLSYGIGFGYVRDIPLSSSGKWALGLGLGYSVDKVYHGLNNSENSHKINSLNSDSYIITHNFDLPIQIRWRDSSLSNHKFWRVYLGPIFTNVLFNSDNYTNTKISGLDNLQKLNYGLELSLGYNILNLYVRYSFLPVFKESYYNNDVLGTKVLKVGLIFYFL